MDTLMELAGSDQDLNGPVALPISIFWAVAMVAALYNRYRYGPYVGYYTLLAIISVVMSLLQLLLFLVAFKDTSVAMSRQAVAALASMLLCWAVIALLGSWSEVTRHTRVHPVTAKLAGPTMDNDTASRRLRPPTITESPLGAVEAPASTLSTQTATLHRLSQLIPEETAPYRIAPLDASLFPAYRPHFAYRRLRGFLIGLHMVNLIVFMLVALGRSLAIFAKQWSVEYPMAVTAAVLNVIVLLIVFISASLLLRRDVFSEARKRRKRQRQLLILASLSLLLVPRCISIALRSTNLQVYIISEVATAIWLTIALWPGALASVPEEPRSEPNALAERGLIHVHQHVSVASSIHAPSPPVLAPKVQTPHDTANQPSMAQPEAQRPVPRPRFSFTTYLGSRRALDNETSGLSTLPHLHRTQSVHFGSHSAISRTPETVASRKRWTIDLDISAGESLYDMIRREHRLPLDDGDEATNVSAAPSPPVNARLRTASAE